jgi:hypothetical protein
MTTLYGDNILKFLIKFHGDEDVGHTTTTMKPILAKPHGTITSTVNKFFANCFLMLLKK